MLDMLYISDILIVIQTAGETAKETKMAKKIKVTEKMSDLHAHSQLDHGLWLTPGSSNPYWANNANFMYDKCVATPNDFLDVVGYDFFDPDADYDEYDEEITIEVKLIPWP